MPKISQNQRLGHRQRSNSDDVRVLSSFSRLNVHDSTHIHTHNHNHSHYNYDSTLLTTSTSGSTISSIGTSSNPALSLSLTSNRRKVSFELSKSGTNLSSSFASWTQDVSSVFLTSEFASLPLQSEDSTSNSASLYNQNEYGHHKIAEKLAHKNYHKLSICKHSRSGCLSSLVEEESANTTTVPRVSKDSLTSTQDQYDVDCPQTPTRHEHEHEHDHKSCFDESESHASHDTSPLVQTCVSGWGHYVDVVPIDHNNNNLYSPPLCNCPNKPCVCPQHQHVSSRINPHCKYHPYSRRSAYDHHMNMNMNMHHLHHQRLSPRRNCQSITILTTTPTTQNSLLSIAKSSSSSPTRGNNVSSSATTPTEYLTHALHNCSMSC